VVANLNSPPIFTPASMHSSCLSERRRNVHPFLLPVPAFFSRTRPLLAQVGAVQRTLLSPMLCVAFGMREPSQRAKRFGGSIHTCLWSLSLRHPNAWARPVIAKEVRYSRPQIYASEQATVLRWATNLCASWDLITLVFFQCQVYV
jgi:hypothetical protein